MLCHPTGQLVQHSILLQGDGHYNLVTFLCSHGAGVDVTDYQVSSVCVCVHDVIDIVMSLLIFYLYLMK